MQENNYELELSSEEETQVNDAVKVLEAVLLPKLAVLSANEKQDMLIMGDKSVAFVDKAAEVARQEQGLLQTFIDQAAFDKDVKAIDQLRSLNFKLTQLTAGINDSYAIAGSEAYRTSLMIYSLMKNAAKMNHPGAKEKVSEMAARFPRKRKKKEEEV
ncbi:hypothetical protein [Carboxylicivirga sp. M1479]|uniref:hypothetical protein n=1 Tax=Carboxylicivirga sp. M1479 TaxID=2594476 RepID=UPI001178852E|nr:hypothetical protein [Carboxylicivirga sp. M1479]TRX70358.1 hypothetical protein FNN09_11565 [Carboxylicivirga sp. M1479]